MSSEISNFETLDGFVGSDSIGVSIRSDATPIPTSAERIRDKIKSVNEKSRTVGKKIGEISIKAYVMTTVILMSGSAGLVYDRMANPNYQEVSPSGALLEAAIAVGGQLGVVALREAEQMNSRESRSEDSSTSLPVPKKDFDLGLLNLISREGSEIITGPIGASLMAYGMTYSTEGGWSQTVDPTPLAASLPTPEDIATLMYDTASYMGVASDHERVINVIGSTLSQVINMSQLCGNTVDCPPVAHPIKTTEGNGMVVVFQGEARSFSDFSEGVLYLEESGWTEAHDASWDASPALR
ncbi:hypothetical protein [Sulfitobacter sp. R18_1]|uniref:hypothetical protein n=1 Tax=Sulfitobacter sp. R18_1 TaxID=2821104 RepID=UPI001ADB614B|nr:hypothetical protein [Sulfitobacter sp. R18_1]MBO9428008.1 hypothetical protein [Sulfitobacter sp. R18_1]